MKTLSSHPLLAAVTLCLLTASAASCSKAAPTPEKASPEAPSSASFAPSASAAVAQAAPPKSALPTLVPEVFEPAKGLSLHPIEGALIVVSGMRVGRIVDERIEWFATLPETNAWLGGSQINDVTGSWPDDVNVVYSSNNDRASQPSIYPLTSKGTSVTFAPGGGQGWIAGTARLGKTTVVGGNDMLQGSRIVTMRGPELVFKPIPRDKGGCKEGELDQPWRGGVSIAVPFSALGATAQGTLVTIGNLCDRPNAPVAEVWDQPGKSRIIDLGPLVKSLGYYPHILNGKGDDLWLATSPVIHYNGGKFEALPSLDRPWKNLFVSPAGKLHGIHGRTIYRHDDEKWTPVANLAWPTWFSSIAMDEKDTLWVTGNNGIARLRAQSGADVEQACTTPFVYLYSVSWKNEAKYTFPATRKALSTFPDVADLRLVEYFEDGKTLGVQVKSLAQGEAVLAHVLATMKDEHPELLCYAPKKPRIIEINAGK